MLELHLGDFVEYSINNKDILKGTIVGINELGVFIRPTVGDYLHKVERINILCKAKSELVYTNDAVVEVTKEFTFDSCHQLLEYIGACARLHGHTYKLQVTLKGKLNDIGMVLDFKDLKKIVKDGIISMFDHYNLNDKMSFNTTAENMSVYIFDLLTVALIEDENVAVTSVKLWETPTSFAEYRGETL